MTTTDTDHQQVHQNESSNDEVLCSSDYRDTRSYSNFQEEVQDVYSFLQEFVSQEKFKKHIKKDAYKMGDIDEELRKRKDDIKKIECPLVFAGEASSGKSSIVNLLLGEKILPTAIGACTTRLCKIKYSENLAISTCNDEGHELQHWSFQNTKDMADTLKILVKTKDPHICYINIWMPVELLKGNVIIVDTPGIGDESQAKVAQMMLDYLRNALAFIFVLNVASCGGLQTDRLLLILNHAKKVMRQMIAFSPEDTIFVLNRWDTLNAEHEEKQSHFDETNERLHKIWPKLNKNYVLKLSSAKVFIDEEYTSMFEHFQSILRKVISRNENKRVKVHLSFLKSTMEECERVLSFKLLCAEQSKKEHTRTLDLSLTELQRLEQVGLEAYKSIPQSINYFLDEATRHLHHYINGQDFENEVLQNIERVSRINVGRKLNSRIEIATETWQEEHIERILMETVLGSLMENITKVENDMHSIKERMMGFTTGFDIKAKIASILVSSFASVGSALVGSIIANRVIEDQNSKALFVVAGLFGGLVFSQLVKLNLLDDIQTITENTFKTKVHNITIEKIRDGLKERYAKAVETIIRALLEEIQNEIENMKESIKKLRNNYDLYKSEEQNLRSIYSTVTQYLEHLKKMEKHEIIIE